jgi:biotin carboxylase
LAVRIQLATQAFLIIMGLREGPSHTELIANDNGIYIVEGHPRTGGDRIVSLVRLTTGIDLIAAYLHQLAGVPYQAQAIKAPVAQTVFIRYPSGATYNGINSLAAYRHGLEELEVNLQVGQLIEAPTHSGNRHALAVIHAANHALCNELALQIQNTLVAQHASH